MDSAPARLTELRNRLLRHHKILLESERAHYERDVQRITSRHHLLQLVLADPQFAWLRELSGLIVVIDEALEADPPPAEADAVRLIAEARALLAPAEHGADFARRYHDALQRDPDVVLAHGDISGALRSLE